MKNSSQIHFPIFAVKIDHLYQAKNKFAFAKKLTGEKSKIYSPTCLQ